VVAGPGAAVIDGGFAVAGDEPPVVEVTDTVASVTAGGLFSSARGLHGFSTAECERSVGTNPFGQHAGAPTVTGVLPSARVGVFVSEMTLAASADRPHEPIVERVDVRGNEVRLHCADGSSVFVALLGPSKDVRLAGRHVAGPVRLARTTPEGELIVVAT
jgi:hypothetical protein